MHYNRDLELGNIINLVLKYKKQVTKIFILCLLISIFISLFISKKYTASITVAPAIHDLKEKDNQVEEKHQEQTTDFDKFLYLLTSKNTADELIKDNKISKNFSSKFSLYSLLMHGNIKGFSKEETLQRYLKRNVLIIDIKNSGMKTIILKHEDSEFAKYLLNRLYKQSDNFIKIKETEKNEKEIDFIKESLKKNNLSENRENFRQLLNHQLRIKSMLSVDLPYSADIVEDVNVSSNPDSPSILLIILFSTFLLGSISSLIFIHFIKENK